MFVRKIAATVTLVATATLAGCQQVTDLLGLGTKTRIVRAERTPRPVDATTPAPPPVLYFPDADPVPDHTFAPGQTVPTARPDGTIPTPTPATPSLTAQVIDLGEGIREFTQFEAKNWGKYGQDAVTGEGNHVAISGVTTDSAGQVYVLAEWMGLYGDSYWTNEGPGREGAWKLTALSSDSATFSLVADGPGDAKMVYGIDHSNYPFNEGYRRKALERFAGYLPATPSPDIEVLVAPGGATISLGYAAYGPGYSGGPTVPVAGVLSADAQERWGGGQTLSFDGLPEKLWWQSEPRDWSAKPQRETLMFSPLSVGKSMAVRVTAVTSSPGVNQTSANVMLWVIRNGETTWKPLTVPGTYSGVYWSDLDALVYQHTWYSPRWPADTGGHWAWAGNATGRVLLYPDK